MLVARQLQARHAAVWAQSMKHARHGAGVLEQAGRIGVLRYDEVGHVGWERERGRIGRLLVAFDFGDGVSPPGEILLAQFPGA